MARTLGGDDAVAGSAPDAIQATVDAFRSSIGGGTVAGASSSFGGVRREINWDGVPDALTAPNNLPANVFNVNSPRGVVFSTPGTGFEISANAASGVPIQFGNVDPSYPLIFETFSAQRLFTALGSTVTDVNVFVAGSTTAALTNAFGVVFTDVDLPNTSSLQFFDAANQSLGTFFVPAFAGNETLSFLGVIFSEGQVVSHVRITSGNQILAVGNIATDLVVMDDFIYGEPRRVPEPSTVLLLALGLAVTLRARLRRSIV